MPNWTYQYEVKGIQDWILATDRLRDLRGGSLLVEDLDRKFEELVLSERFRQRATLVRAAGGVGRADFSDHGAAEEVARWWPLVAAQRLPGITLVQALDSGASAQGAELHAKLAAARNAAGPASSPGGPLAERSPHTGQVATRRWQPPGSDRRVPVDAATAAKLEEAKRNESDAYRAALPAGVRLVADDDSFGRGYRAVIHVDGAGIGECVAKLQGSAEMREFSNALSSATTDAVRAAISSTWRHEIEGRGDEAPTLPLRLVVLGGDDVTLICAGRDALPLVATLAREFERRTADRGESLKLAGGRGLTVGVGIAFIKRGWPFRDAHDLASKLCKAAKAPFREPARASGEPIPSAVCFQRVTTSLLDEHDDDLHCSDPTAPAHHLAGGPYLFNGTRGGFATVDQLTTLRTCLSAAPRGPVREWLRFATSEPGGGAEQDRWRRLRLVLHKKSRSQAIALDQALASMGAQDATPWFPRPGDPPARVTAIADALALLAIGGQDAE